MKKILDLSCGTYGCGYLHDLEYKRTSAFRKGTGISALRRSLNMQYLFPSPVDKIDRGPYPIVVFASGGAWRTPQVHFRIPFLVPLARRGFLVAMPDYRGCELFSCKDAVSDVRSAVRYMRVHGAEYGGDPNRIFLMGESAGAHLALMAAYGGDAFDDENDNTDVSAEVSGVIELYGATDCAREVASKDPEEELGEMELASVCAGLVHCNERSQLLEMMELISPVHYVKKGACLAPALIAHGEEDKQVPVWHAETLYDALTAADIPAEYYRLQHAGHGNWRFYDDEMMDQYASFIRKTIQNEIG